MVEKLEVPTDGSKVPNIHHAQFDRTLSIEGDGSTSSGNSTFAIVVHIELVEVGIVVGIRPGDCLRSIASDVDVKVDSGTSTTRIIPGLTHNFPSGLVLLQSIDVEGI